MLITRIKLCINSIAKREVFSLSDKEVQAVLRLFNSKQHSRAKVKIAIKYKKYSELSELIKLHSSKTSRIYY